MWASRTVELRRSMDRIMKLVIGIVVLTFTGGGSMSRAQDGSSDVPGDWNRSDSMSAIYLATK